MMICTGYQNADTLTADIMTADIMSAALNPLNTEKAVSRDIGSSNGEYESLVSRREHSRCSECFLRLRLKPQKAILSKLLSPSHNLVVIFSLF